jgi:hypothetical protein
MMIAVLLGIALRFVLTYAWVFEAEHIAPFVWLHAHGWSGESLGYLALIVGFCVDTVLSIPAAWAILALRPERRLIYLFLAVVPCFIYSDAYLHWQLRLGWDPGLVLAYAKTLLALPLAAWVLLRVARSRGPLEVTPSN